MTEPRLFNVYCDESCHLSHDGVPVMAWCVVYRPADGSRTITEAVRALKAEHGLAHDFEAQWTKVSPAKMHCVGYSSSPCAALSQLLLVCPFGSDRSLETRIRQAVRGTSKSLA